MSDKVKDVELIPDPSSPKKWKLKHDGKSGTKPSDYPVIDLKKDDGPHLIVFTIKNGEGITFSDDPIWVQEGTTPPSQKAESPQIPVWRIKDNGKKLVAFDWNDNPEPIDLAYRLNFNGADPLDPIIKNGGGTGYPPPPTVSATTERADEPDYRPSYSGVEIVVAAIALLVAVGLGFWLGRR